MEENDKKFFTVVFEGDIGSFKDNPLKVVTPFGTPLIIARGNALDDLDRLKDEIADRELDHKFEAERWS